MNRALMFFGYKEPNFKETEGLYFLFKDKVLIYIGRSKNINTRIRAHEKDFDYGLFFPRLEHLEEKAILLFRPPLNKTYNYTNYISEDEDFIYRKSFYNPNYDKPFPDLLPEE